MLKLLLWAHIAAGIGAIFLGTIAVAARKGGRLHARAGTAFFGSMLVLGITASILAAVKGVPDQVVVGILTCYFVATSWVTARRRDGATGKFEIVACTVALGLAAAIVSGAVTSGSSNPAGSGPVFVFGGLCLLGGLLDLRAVLRKRLTAGERIRRHLWRMCFAFFIATGSFFIGQQDIMPEAVRGSPVLFVLGFAPLAVMAFWLVRLRFAKWIGRLAIHAPRPELAA